jgi:hypothetical protein
MTLIDTGATVKSKRAPRRATATSEIVHTLHAAPLVNGSPVAVFPRRKKPLKCFVGTVEEREADALRQADKRGRDRLGRIPITVTPRRDDLIEALRNFANASENGHSDPVVRRMVKAIKTEAPGWEDDLEGLGAILTSAADEWIRRWK